MKPLKYLGLVLFASIVGTARADSPDPATLAKRIDERLAVLWSTSGVRPAADSDDATFVRRLYLDLAGRIPTVSEARAFLDDPASDKRARLIDQLLSSGGHTRHVATFWRRIWVPQADTPQFARLADGFEDWLAKQFVENVPYDVIVRQMLIASTGRPPRRGQPFRTDGGIASQTFFAASESKPENLAANTARAFLGINLDCAECHNHPFARWTRKQFWETAAFFTPPDRRAERLAEFPGETTTATAAVLTGAVFFRPPVDHTIPLRTMIPGTSRTVSAAVLTGEPQKFPKEIGTDTGSRVLARWLTDKDNPYFAKNAVNRIWADLFGLGLVEPLDDLGGENSPSHPELLDELGRAFAASGYDLKYITKALVLTKAYQLSTAIPESQSLTTDPRLFARMPVRGLTGEQLYDSLRVAAGLPVERDDLDPVNATKERKQFATEFYTERAASAQRSIIQSLAMMNGPTTAALTDPAKTPLLASTASAPFLDTPGKVEALFLATVGRRPTDREHKALVEHVTRGGSQNDPAKALADMFWALLNSSEFNTNH